MSAENSQAKFGKIKKIVVGASVLLATIIFLLWLAPQLLPVEKRLENADAALVFSGSGIFTERLDHAVDVYFENRAPKILLTNDTVQGGWSESTGRNPFYWELSQAHLIYRGVPAESVEVFPQPVFGTQDEAVLLVNTARARNWKRVILVTSAAHTRRVLWATERVARRENYPLEIGVESSPQSRPTFFWWTTKYGWQTVAGEYLKFVYYWLFY